MHNLLQGTFRLQSSSRNSWKEFHQVIITQKWNCKIQLTSLNFQFCYRIISKRLINMKYSYNSIINESFRIHNYLDWFMLVRSKGTKISVSFFLTIGKYILSVAKLTCARWPAVIAYTTMIIWSILYVQKLLSACVVWRNLHLRRWFVIGRWSFVQTTHNLLCLTLDYALDWAYRSKKKTLKGCLNHQ